MSLVQTLRNALSVAKQARQNVDAAAALEAAYAAGAGLEGCLIAYTGTTDAAADNLASVALMERVNSLARLTASAASVLGDAALELAELAAFFEGLQSRPLRDVLEGDG